MMKPTESHEKNHGYILVIVGVTLVLGWIEGLPIIFQWVIGVL